MIMQACRQHSQVKFFVRDKETSSVQTQHQVAGHACNPDMPAAMEHVAA